MAQMWFGNEREMQWVPAPATGMQVTHSGIFEQLVFQNARKVNHRTNQTTNTYTMDFPVQEAGGASGLDIFQRYASGGFGDPESLPLFFADPMNYDQNLFPETWASPGLVELGHSDLAYSSGFYATNRWTVPNPGRYTPTGWTVIPGTGGVAPGTPTASLASWGPTWSTGTSAVSGGVQYTGNTTSSNTNEYVYVTVQSNVVQRVQMFIDWRDNTTALISTASGTQTVLAANTATELTVNAVAPVGAVAYDVRVIAVAGASAVNWAAGNRFTMGKGARFQTAAPTFTPVAFDGDTPGATWFGTRGASMSIYAGTSVKPTFSNTAANSYGLPLRKTTWTQLPQNTIPTTANRIPYVIIPIPPGYKLWLGATGAATGNAQIAWRAYNSGTTPTQVGTGNITISSETGATRLTDQVAVGEYVKIWLNTSAAGVHSLTISSMMAQLWPTAVTPPTTGRFIEGKGARGLNFDDNANVESYVIVDRLRSTPVRYKGLSTSLTEVQRW